MTDTASTSAPTLSFATAERFLLALDETADVFCFQTFDDDKNRKDRSLARVLHGSLEDCWDTLAALNAKGAGVFVTVNAVRPGAARLADNVERVRAVFADFDPWPNPPPQFPVAPHITVASSPGKRHVYWLTDDLPTAEFRGIQQAIAAAHGSDPSVCDLPRVLRLPGFMHRKGEPYLVNLLDIDVGMPYPADRLRSSWPTVATAQPPRRSSTDAPADQIAQRRARKIAWDAARRTHDNPRSSRHREIVAMGGHLCRDGCPADDALFDATLTQFAELMRQTNAAGDPAPLDWAIEAKAIRDGYALALKAGQQPAPTTAPTPTPEPPAWLDDAPPLDEPYTEPSADAPPSPPNLRVVGGTAHDDRPTIQLRNGELPLAVDNAEQYLIHAGADIYQHGTRLVRVGQWSANKGPVKRPTGAGVLIDVAPEWMADQLTRTIRWEKWDGRKSDWRRIDCPPKVATTLLSRAGSWRFPGLVGFTDSPTLDTAGRIIADPGYDEPSGLYLSDPPRLPPMPTTDRYLAERGVEKLDEAFSTFPFLSPADRSACLALLMTALLRRIVGAAPIGGVSASTPGTGKSKLVDVIAAIATGRHAAVVAIGSTPEELEKRLDSILLQGDTLATFDNVDRPIKSDVLCQVATQSVKSIRVMGLSKIVQAPTNVTLMMTGNNLTLVGDLVRRCLIVNLDAGCERPELRQFSRDAVDYVLEHRAELIHAALSISKAYIDAGCPDTNTAPFGSFEQWDRMVRRPLIWAGEPDPLKPAEAMREQDHELTGMRDFLREWQEVAPDALTAAELSELIRQRSDSYSEGLRPVHPGLYEAAIQVFGETPKWGARELGYRMRAIANRWFGGRRIVKDGKAKGGARWRVESRD